MRMKHENPVVIVSGASRGIGKAIATLLAQKEYKVVGLYKKSDNHALSMSKLGVDMIKADAGNETDAQRVIDHISFFSLFVVSLRYTFSKTVQKPCYCQRVFALRHWRLYRTRFCGVRCR